MMLDPYSCEREKELNVQEALAAAEKARLVHLAKDHRPSTGRHLSLTIAAVFDRIGDLLKQLRRAARFEASTQN